MVEYIMTLRLMQKIFNIEIYMRIFFVDGELEDRSVEGDVADSTLHSSRAFLETLTKNTETAIQNTISVVIRVAAQLTYPSTSKNRNMLSVTVELWILTHLA
jgi:hypothetical protein